MSRKITFDEFVIRANEKHNEKYQYFNCGFDNMHSKVKILCPLHGEFFQSAYSHLRGHTCPKCASEKRVANHDKKKFGDTTKEEYYVKLFNQIHGNKYTYRKTKIKKYHDNIIVTCKEHGDFEVCLKSHLYGVGCAKCAGVKRYTTEEFLEKANNIYENEYDYSEVKYINSHIKVKILCHKTDEYGNEHGEFWQTPNSHLNGCGCPKCSYEKRGESKRSNTCDFIEKAKKIHGDKYDYSNVVYKKRQALVSIICKEHGVFQQTPNNHLNGAACPKCKISKLQKRVEDFLKKNNIKYITEKTFDWLKNKKKLRLDFYLPDFNSTIECQGEQHYRPVSFNSLGIETAKINFLANVERDKIKRDLCNKHGIFLCYYYECQYGNKEENSINDLNLLLETIKDNYTKNNIAEVKLSRDNNFDDSLPLDQIKNS